jgi:hypothetical protein
MKAYNSIDELKVAKKELTKLANKLERRASKGGRSGSTLHTLARETDQDFPFGDKSKLSIAVWHFRSYNPFYQYILQDEISIKIIEKKYPKLAKEAQRVYESLKYLALEVKEFTEHIESERERLMGTTATQFLLRASKNDELTKKNRDAMIKYAKKLNKWKNTVISNGELIVNGVKAGKEAKVGVLIGRGIRVHIMEIYVGIEVDKKTKKESDIICARNYTQWRNSDLVVLDIVKNIPNNVIAYS